MNRLQSELHRLYLHGSQAPELIGADGTARALVMTLSQPASWEVLSRVWRGVQTELELPAPAIAVSGIDGLQLWFSLAQPIGVSQAHAFLEALRERFLPDIAPRRIGLMPAPGASAQSLHAPSVPALQEQTGNWSAFVASDLAPVFADTPWLDIPPNEEGQAALLQGLGTIGPAAFEAAVARLASNAQKSHATAVATTGVDAPHALAQPATRATSTDPRQFLRQVMNDDTVPLALRIEAAKALLSNDPRPIA